MEIKSYILAHYIAFYVYNYRLLTFKTPKCVKLYLTLKINNLSVIGIGLGKQEVIGIGGEKSYRASLVYIIIMSCLDVQGQCSLMIMVTRVVPIPFLGSRSVPLSAFNAQDTVLLSIQINGSIQISVID